MGCGRIIAALIGICLMIGGCVAAFTSDMKEKQFMVLIVVGFVMLLAATEFRRGKPPGSDKGQQSGGGKRRIPPPFLNRGRPGPG